jgi:histidine triad (HIT) family protein
MYNHAPDDYICPFCLVARRVENEHVLTVAEDIVWQDDVVTAFIGAGQWPNNRGHVIIIPNQHFEHIYDLPLHLATRIHELARAVALAMKAAYACAGVSTRQHNEPAGNQDVWHYHLHVFPRYPQDHLYTTEKARMPPEERAKYARRLGPHLAQWRSRTE